MVNVQPNVLTLPDEIKMINQNIMDDFARKDTLSLSSVYAADNCWIMPPGAKTGFGQDGKSGKNI